MEQINFNEGALRFYIPEGAIDYRDNKTASLVNLKSNSGHINVLKNKDNGIAVDYASASGACILKTDAQDLDNHQAHQVKISWSVTQGLLKLDVDGQERAICNINSNQIEVENHS